MAGLRVDGASASVAREARVSIENYPLIRTLCSFAATGERRRALRVAVAGDSMQIGSTQQHQYPPETRVVL